MNIAVIDNYDSFTYNLVHLVKSISDSKIDVFRNDRVNPDKLVSYDKILLSPGPGLPVEAGRLLEIINTYSSTKSIFGVCLGLQAIAEANGCNLKNLDEVYHGVSTRILVTDQDDPLFSGLGSSFEGGRYHSWVVENKDIPDNMMVTATDEEGEIMAMRLMEKDVCGVQFHPESILTPSGKIILSNWLNKGNTEYQT